MRPHDGEPHLRPWAAQPVRTVASGLMRTARKARGSAGRTGPLVVAVDGRSGGGKSYLADLLTTSLRSATVVHTDDVAWGQGFFDWDHLLVEGVLRPVSRGEAVAFRPPAWVERDRWGAIEVPADCEVLVVEGVGASRLALGPWLDAAVWVQSDADDARRRGIERDITAGRGHREAADFWAEWASHELPFLDQDRPWERADLVVCGTPVVLGAQLAPGVVMVSSSGPGRRPGRSV